jgi:septum formation protein
MPTPIILASGSETRARLLRGAGLTFEIVPPRIDEEMLRASLSAEAVGPRDMADALAEQKARKVSAQRPDALVIGCDQILDHAGQAIAKPENREAMRVQLLRLRGQRHELISAVVLARGGAPVWRHIDKARLTMREFSDTYLDAYLERNWPGLHDTVGGYKLEEEGVRLFTRIEGSHFTVLGLPLVELLDHLGVIGEIDA